eukprot:scaffold2424_cov62-Cyclotella_meneghiniana.AAC.12
MNGDRESNEDPPSSVDRPTKRVKISTECADTATLTAPPSLPPDAWAAVMECLKLSDVLSLSSTCRAIYHDAVPLVTTLHITKPRQMDPFLSKRFTDIRDIYIYSLLNRQPDYKYDVDFETSVRVATFLSNNFAKAERVFIGCIIYGDLLPYIHWDTDSDLELCPLLCQSEVCVAYNYNHFRILIVGYAVELVRAFLLRLLHVLNAEALRKFKLDLLDLMILTYA